jgi:hypothetical protein
MKVTDQWNSRSHNETLSKLNNFTLSAKRDLKTGPWLDSWLGLNKFWLYSWHRRPQVMVRFLTRPNKRRPKGRPRPFLAPCQWWQRQLSEHRKQKGEKSPNSCMERKKEIKILVNIMSLICDSLYIYSVYCI